MFDFPNTPTVGQRVTNPDGFDYQWDGFKWAPYEGTSGFVALPLAVAQGGTGAATAAAALTNLGALPIAGGTMNGGLVVNGTITTNGNSIAVVGTSPRLALQDTDSISTGFWTDASNMYWGLFSGAAPAADWGHFSSTGLTVKGNVVVTGADSNPLSLNAPAGQSCNMTLGIISGHQYTLGTQAADNSFILYDNTAGATRLAMSSAGLTMLYGGLTITGTMIATCGGYNNLDLHTSNTTANANVRMVVDGLRAFQVGVGGSNYSAAPGGFYVYDDTASATRLVITTAGACSASSTWAVISDMALKENVQPYDGGLAELQRLDPMYFTWNGKGGVPKDDQWHFGLSAEQVAAVFPEMAREQEYTPPEGSDEEPMVLASYSPTDLVFALINAVKELANRLEQVERVSHV